ncbi:MAG: helix-turn-helix domain-containing protein [Planctomycetes bacterium]|nr:helix-turn-helix domain-containing protein [Planctomycetota bacterium]
MEISIREAAALLGRSPRAIRARIARGELPARRRGRVWLVDTDHIPLTVEQRARRDALAAELRATLERAAPPRAATTRDRRGRSVLDFAPFTELRAVLHSCEAGDAPPSLAAITEIVRAACARLAIAAHEFEPRAFAAVLRAARRDLARACGTLFLAGPEPDSGALVCASKIEHEVLPRIGGLLRWAEKRQGGAVRT